MPDNNYPSPGFSYKDSEELFVANSEVEERGIRGISGEVAAGRYPCTNAVGLLLPLDAK